MNGPPRVEDLLRELAPQVLGALVRRFGDFGTAEDAVQEALIVAATRWPEDGVPDNPRAWLVQAATRRLIDQWRSDRSRREREETAFREEPRTSVAERDDSLLVLFMCSHPALTPASAIPLTLRAVGGLTTTEIAGAFLVGEATMGQRIARAKQRIKASGVPFELSEEDLRARLPAVLRVLYLIFNEGYASSSGHELQRTEFSQEAIRLARLLHRALPDEPEAASLLALMLLIDARRPARTDASGDLVLLAEQNRTLWDRALVAEGAALLDEAAGKGPPGEYRLQAAIASLHDHAATADETDWPQILALYGLLEQLTGSPVVTLNKAVAAGMADGPASGLAMLEGLDDRLADHYRLHAVRAHLLELDGDETGAIEHYVAAANRTTNLREQRYLQIKAARLGRPRRAASSP